jgi:hypothetical protein
VIADTLIELNESSKNNLGRTVCDHQPAGIGTEEGAGFGLSVDIFDNIDTLR